ncbi:MAG: hypothetical protein ACI3XS_02705 [Eubacteriales bacterium]
MKNSDFFGAFKKSGVLVEKDKLCSVYSLNYGGADYVVKVMNKRAGKHSIIHCYEADIILEKFYRFGLVPSRTETVMTRKNFAGDKKRGIFVIKGKPMLVKGLDENGFISAIKIPKKSDDVYVMLYKNFKLFEPNL